MDIPRDRQHPPRPFEDVDRDIELQNLTFQPENTGLDRHWRVVSKTDFEQEHGGLVHRWNPWAGEPTDGEGETFQAYQQRFQAFQEQKVRHREIIKAPAQQPFMPAPQRHEETKPQQKVRNILENPDNEFGFSPNDIDLIIKYELIDPAIYHSIPPGCEKFVTCIEEIKKVLANLPEKRAEQQPSPSKSAPPQAQAGQQIQSAPFIEQLAMALQQYGGVSHDQTHALAQKISQEYKGEYDWFCQLPNQQAKNEWVVQFMMMNRRKLEKPTAPLPHQNVPANIPAPAPYPAPDMTIEQRNEGIKTDLLNQDVNPEAFEVLITSGMFNFDIAEQSRPNLLGYYRSRANRYRNNGGALPGDKAFNWNKEYNEAMKIIQGSSYNTVENIKWLTGTVARICGEPTFSKDMKQQLLDAYQHYIAYIPNDFRYRETIGACIQAAVKVLHPQDQYKNAIIGSLEYAGKYLHPDTPVPPPVPEKPESDLEKAIGTLNKAYGLNDTEKQVLRENPPSDPYGTLFYSTIKAWAGLRDRNFPLNFAEFWSLCQDRSDLSNIIQRIEQTDDDISTDPLSFQQAGAELMKVWLRERHHMEPQQIALFSTLSLWSPQLPADMEALWQYDQLRRIFSGEKHPDTMGIAWAASEQILQPDPRANLHAFKPEAISQNLAIAQHNKELIWINQSTPAGDGKVPLSAKTLMHCLQLIYWKNNPEYYETDIENSPDKRGWLAAAYGLGLQRVGYKLNKPEFIRELEVNYGLSQKIAHKLNTYLSQLYNDMRKRPVDVEAWINDTIPAEWGSLKGKINLLLMNHCREAVPTLSEEMYKLQPLLEAANLIAKTTQRLNDRCHFQTTTIERDKVNSTLQKMLNCELRERTIPDGNCGYSALASQLGLTAHEVRQRMAQAGKDVLAYKQSRNIEVIKDKDPAYRQRIINAVQDGNNDDLMQAAREDNISYIEQDPVLNPPAGFRMSAKYWLKVGDLPLAALAFGKSVVATDHPLSPRVARGIVPISDTLFSADGQTNYLYDQPNAEVSQAIHRGALAIALMGPGGSEHWEALYPMPERGPLKKQKNNQQAPTPSMVPHPQKQLSRQERHDQSLKQLSSLSGHDYLPPEMNDPLMSMRYNLI